MSTKLWTLLAAGLLIAALASSGGCSSEDEEPANGAVAPEELSAFCSTLANFFCDRCFAADGSCVTELGSDCARNAGDRNPGGYAKAKGQACLDALANVECEAMPLNCQGNLALIECNDYLDGQTDGVDPGCP